MTRTMAQLVLQSCYLPDLHVLYPMGCTQACEDLVVAKNCGEALRASWVGDLLQNHEQKPCLKIVLLFLLLIVCSLFIPRLRLMRESKIAIVLALRCLSDCEARTISFVTLKRAG